MMAKWYRVPPDQGGEKLETGIWADGFSMHGKCPFIHSFASMHQCAFLPKQFQNTLKDSKKRLLPQVSTATIGVFKYTDCLLWQQKCNELIVFMRFFKDAWHIKVEQVAYIKGKQSLCAQVRIDPSASKITSLQLRPHLHHSQRLYICMYLMAVLFMMFFSFTTW
jgi:hypothetical protein